MPKTAGWSPGRGVRDRQNLSYLRNVGLDAFGIDLSPGMIDVARHDTPACGSDLGSMTDLALADASLTGLVAWYSLIHIPDDEMGLRWRSSVECFGPVGRCFSEFPCRR